MVKRKPTIEDYVNAILDRDRDAPYPKVISDYEITPHRFYRKVMFEIEDCVIASSGETKKTLEAISSDQNRRRELFRMGEEFIKEQYGRLMAGKQAKAYDGTYCHPENVEFFVYHALASNNPLLKSENREEVITGIQNLPTNLFDYLHSIGLGGLMTNALGKGKQGSPLAVLQVFDSTYQRKTGDKSLFDLEQKTHLHEWGDNFMAPQSYWQNPINVENAVYHVLTENNPLLTFLKREEVITGIQNLPTNLQGYLHSIGLWGLMKSAFEKGKLDSPLAVLQVFDSAYQRKTGDKSLFETTQPTYLKFDERNRLVRE